ncbi:MAG: dTDP-4-dehydrorhamnose 3,5-epimerase [Candidatus Desantisbacteria bacterium]
MRFIKTDISEVMLIEPNVFTDKRGYFFESYNQKVFEANIEKITFVQDNESKSVFGTLRGLHYQLPPFAQSKLVRVIQGRVLDIAVDIRKGSPTFAKLVAVELSDENKRQLFIPKGFAHGFVVLSKEAIFAYKVDSFYSREHDRGILYNDPDLNIEWQIDENQILLLEKDKQLPCLKDAELYQEEG